MNVNTIAYLCLTKGRRSPSKLYHFHAGVYPQSTAKLWATAEAG